MECRDAQFYLRLRRHAADELGADVTAAIDGHCATCAACAADARSAAGFDRAVATAMKSVPVPASLRERLVTQAARAQGAALRTKALRAGGMVAAALLAVAIGLGVFTNLRPTVNTQDLVEINGDQFANAEGATQKFLAKHKLPDRLPQPFDYDLHVFNGFEEVAGNHVPVVVFRSPNDNGFAKVYIFAADGRFDLKKLEEAQGSHARAQVLPEGTDQFRGFRYVFVHTGRDLQPFLLTRHNGGGIKV